MQRHDKDGQPYYCQICGNAWDWKYWAKYTKIEDFVDGGQACKFWPDVSECMLESEEDAKERQVKVMSLNDWKLK